MKIIMNLADGGVTTIGEEWTRARIALLRKLWKTPMPSSQIASEISKLPGPKLSKNACCGKAHRMRLSDKPSASSHPASFEFRSEFTKRGSANRYMSRK